MNLWVEKFIDWLWSLLAPGSPRARRRKALRELEHRLKSQNPPWVQTLPPRVFGAVLSPWLRLLGALGPVRELLEKTVLHPEAPYREKVRIRFLESLAGPETEALHGGLDPEALAERFAAAEDLEAERNRLTQEIQRWTARLGDASSREVEQAWADAVALGEFLSLDTKALIHPFGGSSFRPDLGCEPERIREPLLDLHFVAQSLNFGPRLTRSVEALADRIGAEPGSTTREAVLEALTRARALWSPDLVQGLTALIRWCAQDPALALKAAPPLVPVFAGLPEQLAHQAEQDRDRAYQAAREGLLSTSIEALFGEVPDIAVPGYGPELDQILVQNNLPGLVWRRAFSLCRAWYTLIPQKKWIHSLNAVLVDGVFPDREYANALSRLYHPVAAWPEALETFQLSLQDGTKGSAAFVVKAFQERREGKPNPNLTKGIEALNHRVQQFLEDQVGYWLELGSELALLVEDYRKGRNKLINNWHTLAAGKGLLYLHNLSESLGATREFDRLIRHFLVPKHHVSVEALRPHA